MASEYDTTTSRSVAMGAYLGNNITVNFYYQLTYDPTTQLATVTIKDVSASASHITVLSYWQEVYITIGNQTNGAWSIRGRLGATGSMPYAGNKTFANKPIDSTGKLVAQVRFTGPGSFDSTVSVNLLDIPITAPTISATLSYSRAKRTVSATYKYANANSRIYSGYIQINGEGGTAITSISSRAKGSYTENTVWYQNETGRLQDGKTYKWSMYVLCDNGKSTKITGTLLIPASVDSISIGSLNLGTNTPTTTKLPYTLINNYGATNFEIAGVTFSSNHPEIASINSSGQITCKASGYVTFTVKSKDPVTNYPEASKVFFVTQAGAFPFGDEAEETEWLSVPLIERILNACQIVATKQGIVLTTIPEFTGYATLVKNTESVVTKMNANIKKIADAKRISYDTKLLTVTATNQEKAWYKTVNEWLRLMPLFKPYS